MRGGRVGFIENRARLAQHHHARRMTVLRELWYCHVAVLSSTPAAPRILLDFRARTLFYPIFGGSFGGLPGTQNGSCGISSESSRRPLSNDIKFARIGVRTRELWLPEVGVSGAVFVHFFRCEDSGQTGDAIGEPRVPRRSRSHYLSNAPGLADQLVASRKDSAREGGCSGFRGNPSLDFVRYGPASRVHRGVFGPFEGSFPIRIPADPDKILGDPRVPRRAWMCPLSNVPGLADQLVASQEDSVRKRGNVGGEIPELSAKPYFVGLFSRAWPCTEASLGSQDMILRTEAVGMFLMPRVLATTLSFLVRFRPVKYGIEALDILYRIGQGVVSSIPVFGLVNGPVKPWSNLVNLGQTWSNLVKALQTLGNVSRTSFQGFLGRWVLVGLETARSNLGQTLVNSSQTWSTLVKLGQTLGNVSRTFFWEYLRNVGQRINDSIFARSDFLGLRVLLRLSRSLSRFACQSFRSPNGHSRAWRRSVGMRKYDSGLESGEMGQFWELAHDHHARRMTVMREDSDRRSVFAYTSHR
uniref:Uncharacterized protein n=1 Tax=Fagus sylvatica TaxID=28930 RepID=A0A2N9HDJ4_FAGSY